MTGLIGFLGFISFAYVLKLAGDIVSNGESHYRLKRLRVIEIDGRYYIQRRALSAYGYTWIYINPRATSFVHDTVYDIRLEFASNWFFNTKLEAERALEKIALETGVFESKKVVFDTKKSLSNIEVKKLELTDKMMKAEIEGDTEQVELLVKEIIKISK